MTLEILNWTTLFVALSPLFVALIRKDAMSENLVAVLTIGVLALAFFGGKALDGALTWPLSPDLAKELGGYLVVQQAVYQVIKKTSLMRAAERAGTGSKV